jgi:hypothetical protein
MSVPQLRGEAYQLSTKCMIILASNPDFVVGCEIVLKEMLQKYEN